MVKAAEERYVTVLNWQNDPIYFDKEPKEVNEWINANELLESKRGEDIFLPNTQTLNLYPILVRRADFARENHSDRILARLPFIQLTAEEKRLFKDQELLVSERLRDYFYKSDNRKILEWRDILRNYLKREAVPLPFFRCLPEERVIDFHQRVLESSRGETFSMPTTLSHELAYLCGMVNGDGNLTKYVLNIVDYSMENIRQLRERFERLFQQSGRIQLQTENCPKLIITNLWVVRLFSFLTDQPIGGRKYDCLREPLLFSDQPFRAHYWSGVMDADGAYKNCNITFTSTSKKYSEDFVSFMKAITIQPKLTARTDGTFQVYIPAQYRGVYKKQLYCVHPEKKEQFRVLKKGISKQHSAPNPKEFISFNSRKLTNGYFNFNLMKNIQITGLGGYIKEKRNNITQVNFAKEIGISTRLLQQIENEKCAVSIKILEKIQTKEQKSLIQLLLLKGRKLQYRRYRTQPVFLDLKPNVQLKYFTKKMIFYDSYIRINSEKIELIEQIENHFGIKIEDNVITNGMIKYYFHTFCDLVKK